MGVGRDVLGDPIRIMHRLRRAGDQQEAIRRKPHHRQVAFIAATFIEQAGIDRAADRDIDLGGADAVERRHGIAPLHQQLGEGGLVEQAGSLTHRLHFAAHRLVPVLGAEGIVRHRGFARAREPVGPLPAHFRAEAGALGRQPVVERRAAEGAGGVQLAVRPGHGVMQAERFLDPVVQPARIVVEAGEAADIDRPEIHGRRAIDDPFGQCPAGAAGAGDAHRVEAGADIEILQLRRLAKDEIIVRRKTFRAIVEFPDLGGFELRHADQRILHQRLELVPVVFQQGEFEIVGNAVHAPGFCFRLEAAHDEAADLLLEIDETIGIAHDRQVRMDTFDAAGDDIHMLRRMQRHADAAHLPDLARPLAGAIDDDLGGNRAPVGLDAGHLPLPCGNAGDAHPLDDAGAAIARALGKRLRQVGGVGLAVARQPDGADQIVDGHDRPQIAGLLRRDHLDIHPLRAGGSGGALQHGHALGGAGDGQRAAILPAGRQSRLGLQFAIKFCRIADEAGHVGMAAQLADKAGGMPGGAAAELALFEEDDIRPSELRQMIGDRTTDDAAADDDNLRLRGQTLRHETTSRFEEGFSIAATPQSATQNITKCIK